MGSFWEMSMFDEVRRMDARQLIYQALNFAMIVSSALMIWKGLMVVTGSESPIVVVLSGSMEPAFYRGDLLFLTNYQVSSLANSLVNSLALRCLRLRDSF
uniref:Signal peptidase complex catalytic subunit SEC11 n=1 Tax=Plectus sambesii TaxID=2011161 RepID=A0A914W1I7_9BILA